MIYHLRGQTAHIGTDFVIIDVNGIGYRVNMPSRITAGMEVGRDVFINTITIVREDDISLYGFLNPMDREFFLMLLNIPKIGPKSALKILSTLPAVNLMRTILSGDSKALSKVPGIGPKVAQRLIIELKEKVRKVMEKEDTEYEDSFEEAVEVLTDLGCSPIEARDVLARVQKENEGSELDFSQLLDNALNIMAIGEERE